MTLKNLLVLFLCAFILPNISFQATVRRSIASINVTTGYVGEALTLQCEVPDVKSEDKKLEVYFHTNITDDFDNLAVYRLTDLKKFQFSFATSNAVVVKTNISSISQLPSTLTKYEISIVPKAAFKTEFSCKTYYQGDGVPTVTNKVPLVVSLPLPTLTGDNIRMRINQSLSVTCSIDRFRQLTGKNYSVKFYSSLDGQLARYEVNATGNTILSLEEYDNVFISSGARSTYPTYDLVITEKAARSNQSYWCEVFTSEFNSESAHWTPSAPFVQFTSISKLLNGTLSEKRGKCLVEEFLQHSSLEYQVKFYSNIGSKKDDNLIAYYSLKPNKIIEFVAEHHSPWTSTVHGDNVAYPNFEIVTKLSSASIGNDSRWWCVVQISQPGQTNYRLIRSNIKTL